MKRLAHGLSLSLACVVATSLAPLRTAHAEDTWRRPHPGMRWLSRSLPSQQIDVLEVDLCEPGVRLRTTASSERRQTPSSFGRAVNAEAAVNGDFFSFSTYAPTGLAMHAGERWGGTDDEGKGQLVVGSRRVELYRAGLTVRVEPWMREVVGGHPTILRDGTIRDFTDALCTARHPRTALGLSADRRMLYVAVVDGRATGRIGMTCAELARLMREVGAQNALNLDGGGSSAMWIRGRGVVTNPSDGTERVVANHLAIQANGSGGIPHCPIPDLSAELVQYGGGFAPDGSVVLAPGEEVTGFIQLRNTGITAWDPSQTMLGTTNDRDEASPLAGPDWIDPTRAAAINRVVEHGATGRFTFTVRAPDAPGTVRQHFGLVHGTRWFADDGGPGDRALSIEVITVASDGGPPAGVDGGTRPRSGDSGVASDASLAETDAAGGGPSGPEEGETSGGVTSGGCSAAASAQRGTSQWPYALLVLAILARRKRLRRD